MFHLFQTFPQLPDDLAQLIPFLTSAEVLLAVFMLYVRIPLVMAWPDWEKGAVYVVGATVVSSVGILVQGLLTPELLAILQPYYTKFTIILTLVLGFFGLRNAVIRPIAGLWKDWQTNRHLRQEERKAAIEEKHATTLAIERSGRLQG